MPAAKPLNTAFAASLFSQDVTWKEAALKLDISPNRLKRLWIKEFGEEAWKARARKNRKGASEAALQEARESFHTDESFKAMSKRLGISPNTLRDLWVKDHGAEAFKARGEKIKVAGREAFGARTRGLPKKRSCVEVQCSMCQKLFSLSKGQVARFTELVCSGCRSAKKDTECPVCCILCEGQRGLSAHFRHADDEDHRKYLQGEEVRKWEGLVGGEDYVTCKVCSFRGRSLNNHLKTHGLSIQDYRQAYPGSKALCRAAATRQSFSAKASHERAPRKGRTKHLSCTKCGTSLTVPSTLAPSVHNTLCVDCREAQILVEERARWAGKSEGVDYVRCRVCGHKAENLTSHVSNTHPEVEYRSTYPGAPLWAQGLTYGWTPDLLLRSYADEEGRVVVAAVCEEYGCAPATVVSFCRAQDLPTRNRLAWQRLVLDKASHFLGASYEWEWSDPRIVNPETGRVLRYDGYFPKLNLLLEAHGDQHYQPVPFYCDTPEDFESRLKLDHLKEERALALGYDFKVVRSVDPIGETPFWEALFQKGSSSWHQKTAVEKQASLQKVLAELGPFPELSYQTKLVSSALTRLGKVHPHLDDASGIRPYSTAGTTACASFFPNRYDARVGHAPSVREAWDDDVMLRKAIRLQLDSGHPTTPERIVKALVFFCRCPSVFRPAVAKYIYQTYCPSGGVTWDPCAGYGGRLMGAQAAGIGKYIATDVEPLTAQGNKRLAEALGYGDHVEIHEARAETFDPKVPLDLVFTSPPYFDLEVYGSESKKAARDYGSASGWVRHFLTPVISTAFQYLRPGGHLALNLPFRPVGGLRLDMAAERVAGESGFEVRPSVYLPLRSKTKSGKKEPVLIWQKPP